MQVVQLRIFHASSISSIASISCKQYSKQYSSQRLQHQSLTGFCGVADLHCKFFIPNKKLAMLQPTLKSTLCEYVRPRLILFFIYGDQYGKSNPHPACHAGFTITQARQVSPPVHRPQHSCCSIVARLPLQETQIFNID